MLCCVIYGRERDSHLPWRAKLPYRGAYLYGRVGGGVLKHGGSAGPPFCVYVHGELEDMIVLT